MTSSAEEKMLSEHKAISLAKRRAASAWIRERFPKAFPSIAVPLKVGIHKDILAIRKEENAPVSKIHIGRAISAYVRSLGYLREMQVGKARVDLEGEPCGEVSETDYASSQEKLRILRAEIIEVKKKKRILEKQRERDAERQAKIKKRGAEKAAEKLARTRSVAVVPVEPPAPLKYGKILTLKKKVAVELVE